MSTQCRHFVQNAWKKELCSNCFKSREEHAVSQDAHRQIVARTANSVKRVAHKVQGILRLKEASPPSQVRSKRKNVAFPESLTEIIGYDGGDDFGSDYDYDDLSQPDDPDSGCGDDEGLDVSLGSDIDDLPDSEEERALGNLTRANTNFNTVTANLTGAVQPSDVKTFASLMLGRAPKDGEAKKKPLLVTVTPFGGDDSVPTARRPSDKKTPEQTKPKPTVVEPTAKPVPEPVPKKPVDEPKPCEQVPTTKTISSNNSSLGKIVDMPLITSTNLLTVIETKSTSSTESQKQRTTSIARTPAIKKPENEKPRINIVQQNIDQNIARNHKNLEMSNGVELNLSPIRDGEEIVRETTTFGKEIPSYKATDYPRKSPGIADLTERKVEGEAATDKYPFEESRESAGEPDGKADEEVIAEPPALPKSPPPVDSTPSTFVLDKQQQQRHSSVAEPRTSFLHGITESKTIGKPVVPQKPVTLPTKAVGASLASLLSENRAYEFRLSQAARNNSLMHSQSETQLCEEVVTKRSVAQETQSGKVVAESCSELFKATVAKVGDKDDTTEEDEDEDDSEASSTDQPRSNANKRRMAPQPPASNATVSTEDSSPTMFARNPAPTSTKSDCPVVREKEKRERASSCSPKFRKSGVCNAPDPSQQVVTGRPPEPAPRRNISLSQDSLAMAAGAERIVEEKKKTRSKFSLKKFLRMGTRKDVDMTGGSSGSRNDEIPSTPQPKPRLEIIHPLELDGAAVQVLRNDKSNSEDTTDSKSGPQGNSGSTPVHGAQHVTTRPSKPPPPPRSQSLDESSRPTTHASSPKQAQQSSPTSSSNGKPLTGKSWQPSGGSGSSASDSIYANLVAAMAPAASGPAAAAEDVAGAIRSGLAPAKPRRTSSMRDQANNNSTGSAGNTSAAGPTTARMGNGSGGNNAVAIQRCSERQNGAEVQTSNDTRYKDRSSCSPDLADSTTSLELRQGSVGYGGSNHPITKRQSDSGALESNSAEMKFQQSLFIRSTSLPYCASEAESEMYSPFGYYYGDESGEDGQERKKDEETRIGRLRQRRGRSIVHRSLEDNYGAVIVANHEALAQFLEQMNQAQPIIPSSLRSLKTASNLQLNDFSIERSSAVSTGRRIFLSAVWNEQNVTVCLAFDPSMHASRKEFYLVPIVEFVDTVPKDIADLGELKGRKSPEATISVLPRLQVNTLKSFAELMASSESGGKDEHSIRESSFVLLQLVSALKSLQARGVEEAPRNLANIVLCREDKDAYHRLYMFQGLSIENCENNEEEYASLCQCAQNGLEELNLAEKLPLIQELLMREKAVTLSQVKSVLEFSLWGPSDATLGGPREREQALQRWLDLERATVLHALVRARAQLTVTDEYQLLFLVRTSAKIMCEASLLLDRQRNGLLLRSN